jgi:Putative peptidoglycan binding domain
MAQDPLIGAKIRVKVMKRVFALILLAFAAAACTLAAPAKSSKKTSATAAGSAHKGAKASSSHTSAGPSRSKTASAVRVKYVRGRNGKLIRVVSRSAPAPSYQLHPDPERYQQIQQALADKGYFKGQVNGQWGDDSVDALTRFQTDQKLDGDGHLNALTLIGLGLGPKHGNDISTPASATPNPPNNSVPNAPTSALTPPAAVPNTGAKSGSPSADSAGPAAKSQP